MARSASQFSVGYTTGVFDLFHIGHLTLLKNAKIDALSQKKKVNSIKLIAGYILSILVPVAAIIIGMTIVYNRNVLPNGQKFYIHTEKERDHGRKMKNAIS